jgi:DNA-binding MarR family transcriptional regulator
MATRAALTEKQRRILTYLREAEGTYFKSRRIAAELGLSAKEVGTNMPALESAPDVEIERWGYSSATTWKVTG